jgi:hypothetical protein
MVSVFEQPLGTNYVRQPGFHCSLKIIQYTCVVGKTRGYDCSGDRNMFLAKLVTLNGCMVFLFLNN